MSLSRLVKSELPFLEFLLHNKNSTQNKLFLRNLLSNTQYKVLREIAHNCLNERIPLKRDKKNISPQKEKFNKTLQKLQRGELPDHAIPQLLELLKLLIKCTLRHHIPKK